MSRITTPSGSHMLDAVDNFQVAGQNEMTSHPMVTGDVVGDHIIVQPCQITFNGTISLNASSPVKSLSSIQKIFEDLKDNGVHFKNYGRTISGVDPAIFNNVDSYEIPDGVTTICPEAFAMSNLQSVYIPSSVRTLGNSCFHACKNLREVIFADDSHVGLIPEYCFAETAISFMELPNSVFSIQIGFIYLPESL